MEHIWDLQASDFTSPDWASMLPTLNDSTQAINKAVITLKTNERLQALPLEYSSHTTYPIVVTSNSNGSMVESTVQLTAASALESFIASASSFQRRMDNMPQYRQFYQLEALFIEANGGELLPRIALSAMKTYLDYAQKQIKRAEQWSDVIRGVLFGVVVIGVLALTVIGASLGSLNHHIVDLYNEVKLWDVS